MSQTVLITGASRGIGAETARRFAAGGYQVAVNYFQSKDAAFALCDEIGNGAFPVCGDVSDPAQVSAMADTVLERFGHLDVLVCNAGISLPGMLLQDVTDQQWSEVLSVDASGVFYAVRAVLPHMLHQHAGRIVTISSMWGQVGGACEVAYSAAKSGIYNLTRYLATYWGKQGIRVNTLTPAGVWRDTQDEIFQANFCARMPMGRMSQENEYNGALIFLASQASSFMTGSNLVIDGGWTAW